jgi:hypothetical protein
MSVSSRVTCGDLFADLLVDKLALDDRWIYVVQREGPPEILAMKTVLPRRSAPAAVLPSSLTVRVGILINSPAH